MYVSYHCDNLENDILANSFGCKNPAWNSRSRCNSLSNTIQILPVSFKIILVLSNGKYRYYGDYIIVQKYI